MLEIITVTRVACAASVLLGSAGRAEAQGLDLTFFIGRAFPIYDERLTLRPPSPTVPGVEIGVVGSPLIEADGGPVFGGALRSSSAFSVSRGDSMQPKWGSRSLARGQPSRHSAALRWPHCERYGFRWEIRRRSHPAPVGERENPHARYR